MILSDKDIRQAIADGRIGIDPFEEKNLKAGSCSLTLAAMAYRLKRVPFIDTRNAKPEYEEITIGEDGYLLEPGGFIVGATRERITLSSDVAAMVSTRGSRAQMGLDAICSSSFVEPGTNNRLALEMHNSGTVPLKLFPGISVVKIFFFPLSSGADAQGRALDFFKRQGIE